MSSTYRKCPVVRYISKGVVYSNWKDIPDKDWFIEEEKRKLVGYEEKRVYVRNPKYQYGFFDIPKMVKEPIYEWVKTGRKLNIKRQGDHSTIYVYDKKTPEGKRERWGSASKKEYKQAHHRRTRRKEHNVIVDVVKGDLDKEIPTEKRHDLRDMY